MILPALSSAVFSTSREAFEVARVEIAAVESVGLEALQIGTERNRDSVLLPGGHLESKTGAGTKQVNRIVAFTDAVAGGPAHEDEGPGVDLHSFFRGCEVEQFGGAASLAAEGKCHSAAAQIVLAESGCRAARD